MATSWRNLGNDLPKKRMHTEDDDLPKYISRIREEGRRSGFSVYDPRSGRTRVVRGKRFSLAEKLDIAKKMAGNCTRGRVPRATAQRAHESRG